LIYIYLILKKNTADKGEISRVRIPPSPPLFSPFKSMSYRRIDMVVKPVGSIRWVNCIYIAIKTARITAVLHFLMRRHGSHSLINIDKSRSNKVALELLNSKDNITTEIRQNK